MIAKERMFGLTMAIAFAILASLALWRDYERFAIGFGVIAAAFVLLLLAPRWLARVENVWMRFARALGAINTRIIMSVFYFLVILPLAVAMRAFGRDLMRRNWLKQPSSTWEDYRPRQHDPRHYENMF